MKKDIVKIIRIDLNKLTNSFRTNILRRTETIVLTVLTDNITIQRGRTFKEYQKIPAPIILIIRPKTMFRLNRATRFDKVTSIKPFLRKKLPKENNIPQIIGNINVNSI